jgi:hypothetical protein
MANVVAGPASGGGCGGGLVAIQNYLTNCKRQTNGHCTKKRERERERKKLGDEGQQSNPCSVLIHLNVKSVVMFTCVGV